MRLQFRQLTLLPCFPLIRASIILSEVVSSETAVQAVNPPPMFPTSVMLRVVVSSEIAVQAVNLPPMCPTSPILRLVVSVSVLDETEDGGPLYCRCVHTEDPALMCVKSFLP